MKVFVGLLDLADGSTLVTNVYKDNNQAIGETLAAFRKWVKDNGRNEILNWDVVETDLVEGLGE